jgi:hypothetical protein
MKTGHWALFRSHAPAWNEKLSDENSLPSLSFACAAQILTASYNLCDRKQAITQELSLNYNRLQLREIQIILGAQQCCAPNCVLYLPEKRCTTVENF